jgi:hypothetical protein
MIQAQHNTTGETKTFTETEWKIVEKTGYYTLIGRITETVSARSTTTSTPRGTLKTTPKTSGGCGCSKKK